MRVGMIGCGAASRRVEGDDVIDEQIVELALREGEVRAALSAHPDPHDSAARPIIAEPAPPLENLRAAA